MDVEVYLALNGYGNYHPVHEPTVTDLILVLVIGVALNLVLVMVLQKWLDDELEELRQSYKRIK
ncbi:hypothetical protein [Pedobacter antarcticus]|uniref:hypothetical protein n=1 Tax=Pedobacter antarcticus TaxID=34086 RepID=UPI000885F64F|nr:hypothetical protein [Pedobacter antarcticus]SDM84244.1 hypothetical protein SAMN04488084_11561 [Pedobacter antarcticus]